MVKISGGKKFLVLVALSFPFIAGASDSPKTDAGKDTPAWQWACCVGAVACFVDLCLLDFPDILKVKPEKAILIKLAEGVLGCGFVYGGWFYEPGLKSAYSSRLKDSKKKQHEENIEQAQEPETSQEEPEQLSRVVQDNQETEPEVTPEDEQEEKSLRDYQEKQTPKKKRLRDKFKAWLKRHKN